MERALAAIVLAAGYSSRMGDFKPLLTFGGLSVLERVVLLFRDEGIRDIRVVIGHRADELRPLVERLHAQPVINERYDEGMFSSVLAGVGTLTDDVDAFFLLPVDIPLVSRETVGRLIQAYRNGTGGVFYPVYHGERGHPPLVSGRYREEIISWCGDGGLKSVLSRHDDEAVDVLTDDETILLDMDTPEHYEQLRRLWARKACPGPARCRELLLGKFAASAPVVGHSRNVAKVGVFLAEKLNATGCRFVVELIESAALLHDIAKGQPDHAVKGAEILAEMGYDDIARLVAVHMNIVVGEGETVTPAEILYLADKLASGNRCVALEERFARRLQSHALEPEIRRAVEKRLENARTIKAKIEKRLGQDLYELLRDNKFM